MSQKDEDMEAGLCSLDREPRAKEEETQMDPLGKKIPARENINRSITTTTTRETVEKVYQMLEKHKATSSDSSSKHSAYFDFDESPSTGTTGATARPNTNRNRRGRNSPTSQQSPSRTKRGARNANPTEISNCGETEEDSQLARLRCPSERTELISEREQRRRKRCANYPGLAVGLGSVFGSDTMMKFSIIGNELHNVIKGQLKRVS